MKNYAIDFLKRLNDSARFVPEFRKEYGMPLWDDEIIFEYENSKVLLFPVLLGKNARVHALLYFVFGKDGLRFNTLMRGKMYPEFGDTEALFLWLDHNVFGETSVEGIRIESPRGDPFLKEFVEYRRCWVVMVSADGGSTWTQTDYFCSSSFYWSGDYGDYGGENPYEEDAGDWGDPGGGSGGSPEPPNHDPLIEPSDSLFLILNSFINFSPEDILRLNNTLYEFLNNCYNGFIFNSLINDGLKFYFAINSGLGGNASYNHISKTITFRSNSDISLLTLREELFHAYQHSFYGYSTSVKSSNMEFEAKLFAALMDFPTHGCCPEQMAIDMPSSFYDMIIEFYDQDMDWTIIISNYNDFLNYWHENRPQGYYDYNLFLNNSPYVLENIFLNSSCPIVTLK